MRQQLDEARLDGLAHPAFDATLPRAAVLVTTGRLVGAAPVQAQNYSQEARRRQQPGFEVWDRETLLDWLVDSPEAGLAGTSDGPIFALVGAVDSGQITLAALERHARTWLPAEPDTLQAATDPVAEVAARQRRAAVEAAVLGNRLRRRGRLDLAAMTALLLLRAAWCHALAASPDVASKRPAPAEAATRLFATYATELLDQVEPIAQDPPALIIALGFRTFMHAAYPAACSRIAEVLGLLGLLAATVADDEIGATLPSIGRVTDTVLGLLNAQPGCAHPISDAFAVSLLAPVLLSVRRDPAAAEHFLRRAAVWVVDAYDGERGLAGPWADAGTEVAYLLGRPFEEGPDRRPVSYLATVLIDLAAVTLPVDSLYMDLVNDFLAVDADPHVLRADERRAQWRPAGPGSILHAGVRYAEPIPADGHAAAHFADPEPPVPAWDALALTSVARDRHSVVVLRRLASYTN